MTDQQTTPGASPVRSIQVSNTPHGGYDVKLPLAYPYRVQLDGHLARVLDRDDIPDQPAQLAGFQHGGIQEVALLAADWFAGPPDAAVGMHPVFIDRDGGMWNHAHPVDSVQVLED